MVMKKAIATTMNHIAKGSEDKSTDEDYEYESDSIEDDNSSSSYANYSPEDDSSEAKMDLSSDNRGMVHNVLSQRRYQSHTRTEVVGS